ncbi:hypothetical protein [Mucilaginibacter sp. SG564]|uniref:hypothetical protein n=1 Tax=Mucilaginibacter sp. SG564 TaxID=2587022 RepID=UPI001557C92B|nr:hypothetical protein [Mucilaginibacter sp. SG564]NOW94668.1 hypothetical protein [Mucilaginibacter sp. SG564]
MKKISIMMLLATAIFAAACSKKNDNGVDPPANKGTSISVQSASNFTIAIDTLYIAVFKGTTIDQINSDKSPDSHKTYKIGPLPKGQTSAALTIDPQFKSCIVLYKNYNSILKQYLVSQVMSLGDGTNTNPYVLKTGEAKTIVLDDKTKTKFIY